MRRLVTTVEGCQKEAELRACTRIEQAMDRLIKAALKRRNGLEVRLGYSSPEYHTAALEYIILQHWRDYMRRNCDYRRMQVDREELKQYGQTQGRQSQHDRASV